MSNLHLAHHLGLDAAGVKWSGVLKLPQHDMERVLRNPNRYLDGWLIGKRGSDIILMPEPNLVAKVGVARSADRVFNISGGTTVLPLNSLTQDIARIGADNGTTNPTADSVSSNTGGGADTGSSSQTLRTFDSTETRANLTVTCVGTFNDATTGGIGAVSWSGGMRRFFLSAHNANITNTTAADADGTLYSMTNVLTIDLTSLATWTAVISATVLFAGS